MNTETYKVAKEILDKYGPAEQLRPKEPIKVKLYNMKISWIFLDESSLKHP